VAISSDEPPPVNANVLLTNQKRTLPCLILFANRFAKEQVSQTAACTSLAAYQEPHSVVSLKDNLFAMPAIAGHQVAHP
jgi:hypothetical protein